MQETPNSRHYIMYVLQFCRPVLQAYIFVGRSLYGRLPKSLQNSYSNYIFFQASYLVECLSFKNIALKDF